MIELPEIDSLERAPDGDKAALTLHFTVPATLRYFEGHFPGVALLPGVVQIGWAIELARRHLSPASGRLPEQFRTLSAVKFTQVIQPGARICLRLAHEAPAQIAFEYRVDGKMCSSGRVAFH